MTKHFLLVVLTALSCTSVFAQKNLTFGAEIGPNLSGGFLFKCPTEGSNLKGTPGVGFELGILAEMPLQGNYAFRARLQYSHEDATVNDYGDNYPVHLSYIRLPLDFIYRPSAKNNPWFFGAGPYVAMGVGGKYKFMGYSEHVDFGADSTKELKRLDIGLNLLAGYQFTQHLFFAADLNLGALNIVNDKYWGPGNRAHTLNLAVTVGYVLGKK